PAEPGGDVRDGHDAVAAHVELPRDSPGGPRHDRPRDVVDPGEHERAVAPRTRSRRGASHSAVIWLATPGPRIVPIRRTTCPSPARISSASRVCREYVNSSLPRSASPSRSGTGLSA